MDLLLCLDIYWLEREEKIKGIVMKISQCCLFLGLLGISQLSVAKCPSMQGTWLIEGSQAEIYILNNENGEAFQVWFPNEKSEYHILPVFEVTAKERKEEKINECAIVVSELGIITPAKKGEETQVTTQSQNYTSKKTINTDYVIQIYSGFASDVIGITKMSKSVSPEIKQGTLLLVEEDRASREYQHQLDVSLKAAEQNNPAAQLMLAKSSSLATDNVDYGDWYRRLSYSKTREHWLDKAVANNYGPAWCYKAETLIREKGKKKGSYKYNEIERTDLYKKALAAGNAPLAGVRLADLTQDKTQKIDLLVKAAQQGSLVALWKLEKIINNEKRNHLPADVQQLLKTPPVEKLKQENPDIWERYVDYIKTDDIQPEQKKDIYQFDLPGAIERGYRMSDIAKLSGTDKDYEDNRKDCIEKDLLKLSDYPEYTH